MEIHVEIEGLRELNEELDRRFGKANMQRVVDRALLTGAKVIKRELESSFLTFKDTGGSIEEITLSDPLTLNGERSVVIYWSGPKNRYSIIHLNEFGTIKNPVPRGKGAIERALRAGQEAYFKAVERELVKGTWLICLLKSMRS